MRFLQTKGGPSVFPESYFRSIPIDPSISKFNISNNGTKSFRDPSISNLIALITELSPFEKTEALVKELVIILGELSIVFVVNDSFPKLTLSIDIPLDPGS